MRNPGFTLTELMITLVIIGILASTLVPVYSTYVREARRSDATGTLQKLLNQQALYYANNGGEYTSSVRKLGFNPVGADSDQMLSDEGHYRISLELCDGGTTSLTECVQLTATTASEVQIRDIQCRQIGINSRGTMFAYNASDETDAQISAACWK